MSIIPIESGAGFVAFAPYLMNTLNFVALGAALYPVFGDEDPVEAAEESISVTQLDQCLKGHVGFGVGFTNSARAMALSDLDNWRAYAKKELANAGPVAQAAAQRTIDRLEALYGSQTDSDGKFVGPCHVLSGTFIILKTVDALKTSPEIAPQENAETPRMMRPGLPPTDNQMVVMLGIVGAAVAGLYLLRRAR